jgi:hypothetical protein
MRDLSDKDLANMGGWAGRSAPAVRGEDGSVSAPSRDDVRAAMMAAIDRFRKRTLGGLHYLGPAPGGGVRLQVRLDGQDREIVARRSGSDWVLVASSSSGDAPYGFRAPAGAGRTREQVEAAEKARKAAESVAARQLGSEAMLPGLLRGMDVAKGLQVKLAIGAAGAPLFLRVTRRF